MEGAEMADPEGPETPEPICGVYWPKLRGGGMHRCGLPIDHDGAHHCGIGTCPATKTPSA